MAPSIVIGNLPRKAQGFTFLGLLVIITLAGIGMATVGVVWSKNSQREREKDLLYIGHAYQRAIASYYENKEGTAKKQYPQRLEDLVEDKRSGTKVIRHLRKLYKDPMTRGKPWGLLKQQGGIVGVFSTSSEIPIQLKHFEQNRSYQDWVFRSDAGNANN